MDRVNTICVYLVNTFRERTYITICDHIRQMKKQRHPPLAKNLAAWRESRGLTQEILSRELGYKNQSNLGNYESGAREPSISELVKISEALGVTVDTLLSRKPYDADPAAPLKAHGVAESKPEWPSFGIPPLQHREELNRFLLKLWKLLHLPNGNHVFRVLHAVLDHELERPRG